MTITCSLCMNTNCFVMGICSHFDFGDGQQEPNQIKYFKTMTRVHKKEAHLLNSTCMPSEWWKLETETASNPVLYALLILPLPFPTQIHLSAPEDLQTHSKAQGVPRAQRSHQPFSPRFFFVLSMWSLSWMRTCRSLGWSLMKGCFISCSVVGLWLWFFTRQLSMKD